MRIVFILALLFSLNSHAGLACAQLLSSTGRASLVSSPQKNYVAEVWSSPVKRQYIGSCAIFSHIGLLENYSKTHLDVDYNKWASLLERAQVLLLERTLAILDNPEQILKLDKVNLRSKGWSLRGAASNIAMQGVLEPGQHKVSQEFSMEVSKIFDIVSPGEEFGGKSEPPLLAKATVLLEILFNQVGRNDKIKDLHFARRILSILSRDIGDSKSTARKTYDSLFGGPLKFTSLSPVNDLGSQHENFWWIFRRQRPESVYTVVDGFSELAGHYNVSDAKILEFIIKTLDSGRSLQLGFADIPEMTNVEKGVSKLKLPPHVVPVSIRKLRRGAVIGLDHHAVLIENYRLTDAGDLVFLIKDSQGKKIYDEGYRHMTADFLLYTMLSVFAVTE